MVTLQDIQTALATGKADEQKLTDMLTASLAANKDLSNKLDAAITANDPAQLQAVKDEIDANNAAMQSAIDAASPPATPAAPAPAGGPPPASTPPAQPAP